MSIWAADCLPVCSALRFIIWRGSSPSGGYNLFYDLMIQNSCQTRAMRSTSQLTIWTTKNGTKIFSCSFLRLFCFSIALIRDELCWIIHQTPVFRRAVSTLPTLMPASLYFWHSFYIHLRWERCFRVWVICSFRWGSARAN